MERIMQYILCIYKEKSFSKAASRLFITQPALSLMVQKEEKKRGISFFNRNVNPIIPTEAGLEYIQAAMKIQKIEQQLDRKLHALSNTLTVASSAFFCANVLPQLTDAFAKSQTGCRVHCLEGSARELVSFLQDGRADFVISVDEHYGRNTQYQRIRQEYIILAAPRSLIQDSSLQQAALPYTAIQNGTFAQLEYSALSLKHFSGLPFILLTKGNDLYARGRKILRNAGVTPSSITYMDQLQTSFLAAQTGQGLVFIRAELANIAGDPRQFYFYKIDDALALRDVKIFYQKARLSPLKEAFLTFCTQHFGQ